MKQNLLVVSFDYELSKKVAKALAEGFSMRYFDQIELFEFDHVPRNLSQVCEEFGTAYVQKELRSIVETELDFDDAVFVVDMSFVDYCHDLFYKIKLSNFVVMLKKNIESELDELSKKTYKNESVKSLIYPDDDIHMQREMSIRIDLADVEVDVTGKNQMQIVDEIVDKIKNYYSVN